MIEGAGQRRQQDLERLRSLRPIGGDFMRCLFKDDIPLAQLVLRIITGKPDLVITECQTQKDVKRLAGARSICLDAYAIFIIEKDFYGLGGTDEISEGKSERGGRDV